DLAVHDAALRQGRHQVLDQLGEVPGERAVVAGAELELVAVAEDDAAEAVPLRLVAEADVPGHRVDRLGEHRLAGRAEGQAPVSTLRDLARCRLGGSSPRCAEDPTEELERVLLQERGSVDVDDTEAEAAIRAEARAWLRTVARPRGEGDGRW